jgi:hypothetical protein
VEQAHAAWARAGGREVTDQAGKLGHEVRKGGGGGLGLGELVGCRQGEKERGIWARVGFGLGFQGSLGRALLGWVWVSPFSLF